MVNIRKAPLQLGNKTTPLIFQPVKVLAGAAHCHAEPGPVISAGLTVLGLWGVVAWHMTKHYRNTRTSAAQVFPPPVRGRTLGQKARLGNGTATGCPEFCVWGALKERQ